jgi:hypothetical protein
MTLRLTEDGTVATIQLPESTRDVPAGIALSSSDRVSGLLLRSLGSPLRENFEPLARTRLRDVHRAA